MFQEDQRHNDHLIELHHHFCARSLLQTDRLLLLLERSPLPPVTRASPVNTLVRAFRGLSVVRAYDVLPQPTLEDTYWLRREQPHAFLSAAASRLTCDWHHRWSSPSLKLARPDDRSFQDLASR
ncbi:unnamed protein product [Mycena citricolor]|uniref:Uncharacterized protein n=1 Tax=Mycena citricolor TaxID=2018698 RepID=A0AAD2HRI0_9AGAR|nr:unnamed protein product [Mycena citricolor]